MEFTYDILKPYFDNTKKHLAYDDTVKIEQRLKVHADGEYGGKLITGRRPSESPEIQKYRQEIFAAITEGTISKIITSLGKIRRSSDWSVKYDADKQPKSVLHEESLEQYCEYNYPEFESITKWVFDVLLKNYLVDPNGVILVMHPPAKTTDTTVYPKPTALIFNSENVFDYVDGEYAILYSTDKSEYTSGKMSHYDGKVFYTINQKTISRWEQVDAKGNMSEVWIIPHNQPKMPCFKMRGVFQKAMDKIHIYKSRINACVAPLNEALREHSDLQAEVVQHVHSTFWYIGGQECAGCKGSGKLLRKGVAIECDKCKGKGKFPVSPYSNIQVDRAGLGEGNVPTPPAGYIEKNVEIVKVQDERIDKHIYKALASINMEFLAKTPLSESGIAKNVDRDVLNTFVSSVAEDLVSMMDKVYFFICNYRYYIVVSDAKARREMLPKIPVPQFFDLLSSDYLLAELQTAKTAKLNTVTLIAMEIDFANKKFSNDPMVRDMVKAVFELDPLAGLTEDEKLMRLQNEGITEEDYVISCNIIKFIRRAIEENKSFLKLKDPEKMVALSKYAQDVIDKNSAAADIMAAADPATQIDLGGGQ